MSEMRQIVPSESDVLTKVRTYRNLPHCHDVFDINGDGRAEALALAEVVAPSAPKPRLM